MKIGAKNDEIDRKHAKFQKKSEKIQKIEKSLPKICKNFEFGTVQRRENLVDLEKR